MTPTPSQVHASILRAIESEVEQMRARTVNGNEAKHQLAGALFAAANILALVRDIDVTKPEGA